MDISQKKAKEIVGEYLAKKRASRISMKEINIKSYSKVWDQFSGIKFDLTEEELEDAGLSYKKITTSEGQEIYVADTLAACNQCDHPLTHDSISRGTTNLLNHLKICKKLDNNSSIISFTSPTQRKISANKKAEGDLKMVEFIAGGLRPMSLIDDQYLRNLLQHCVSIGALYGNIDINRIFNMRGKYEELVNEKYDEIISSLSTRVAKAYGLGYTSDDDRAYDVQQVHMPHRPLGQYGDVSNKFTDYCLRGDRSIKIHQY